MDDLIELNLYHGTSLANARSILANGINLTKRRLRSNNHYGDGFYLTNVFNIAAAHASDEFDDENGVVLKANIVMPSRYMKTFSRYDCDHRTDHKQFVDLAFSENCSLLDLSIDDGIYIICCDKNIDVNFELYTG